MGDMCKKNKLLIALFYGHSHHLLVLPFSLRFLEVQWDLLSHWDPGKVSMRTCKWGRAREGKWGGGEVEGRGYVVRGRESINNDSCREVCNNWMYRQSYFPTGSLCPLLSLFARIPNTSLQTHTHKVHPAAVQPNTFWNVTHNHALQCKFEICKLLNVKLTSSAIYWSLAL